MRSDSGTAFCFSMEQDSGNYFASIVMTPGLLSLRAAVAARQSCYGSVDVSIVGMDKALPFQANLDQPATLRLCMPTYLFQRVIVGCAYSALHGSRGSII